MSIDEISAGLGTAADFRRRMLALVPQIEVLVGRSALRPLAGLRTETLADPTVALIDAYAAVADVLSFYQDRVLNEGFLTTALEQSSLALFGQSLALDAGLFPSATVEIALLAQPGTVVTVPLGAAFQASPAKGTIASDSAPATPAPTFLAMAGALADPALNQLTPVQTRPPILDPAGSTLLLAGTGLGLASGDFLLLVRPDPHGDQWVRLTVHGTRENSTLGTTLVDVGSSLIGQWRAGGATAPFPTAAEVQLHTLDLTCRLFGYNAPQWSQQPVSVQRAVLPPGQVPSEYSEWPDFAIDFGDLDLQAVYSKLLPGSKFLLETPQGRLLADIAAVGRDNLSEYGVTGQASRVTLASGAATLPAGLALIPARWGHSATPLADGRILIVGGFGTQDGQPVVLDSVELYDPATGLATPLAALPAARGGHSATMLDGVVVLAGGLTDGSAWATQLLALDPVTLTFSATTGPPLAVPRLRHAATALPDGSLMLSGGLTGPAPPRTPDNLIDLTATASVVSLAPDGTLRWQADMARPRCGHSATLCPVTPKAGGAALGQVVVFLGGQDGATLYADAELTDAIAWQPTGGTPFPIAAGAVTGSARTDHVAVPLPTNGGFLVTGGIGTDLAVADNWLVAVTAAPPAAGAALDPSPLFVAAPAFATARGRHAAALLADGSVVAAGGESGDIVLGSAETFAIAPGVAIATDGSKVVTGLATLAPLPGPETRAAFAALASGELLVAGGLSALPDTITDAVVAYDPAIGTLARIPGPVLEKDTLAPTASLALRDGTILIVGASRPPRFPASAPSMTGYGWTFDPATGLSTETKPPITPRLGATLAMLNNGTVLVAGGIGLDKQGFAAALDSAEIYDPRDRSFRSLGSVMTVPRFGHSATALADGSVLIAGGFALPPVAYDEPGLRGAWLPGLDSAEIFSATGQGFAAVATPMPQGVGLHSATLLPSGDVLIAGGAAACWTLADQWKPDDFPTAWATPVTQAVIYDVAAQGFAQVAAMADARAGHAAVLLANGQVLVTGGGGNPALAPIAAAELYDPARKRFASTTPLAVPRRGHAMMMGEPGLLVIGGVGTKSYEVRAADGSAGKGGVHPLPFALPSPALPELATLTMAVTAIPIADHGVYAFGGAITDDAATSMAVLFVGAGPPPGAEARRQAMVYSQSSPLVLAPPIDTLPLTGDTLSLTGMIDGLEVGHALLITGNPPLAATYGRVWAGTEQLADGTVVMPLAPLSAADRQSPLLGIVIPLAQAKTANRELVTLATNPSLEGLSGLRFLSGNGSTIGNIPAAALKPFDRPLLGEAVTVSKIALDPAGNSTLLTLTAPLQNYYDRTTTTLYGNIVEAAEGAPVTGEVLGSGDGRQPFQQFLLKQAPLAWLEDLDGTLQPLVTVRVGGVAWQQVAALGASAATDQVYQLLQDAAGRALIQFGDGVHGQRLPTGTDNITADYCVGSGAAGNVAAGSLTRPPTGIAGLKAVLNPLAATGGITPSVSQHLRTAIPQSVQNLGRIVTYDDMLSFVLNRPEVGQARLDLPDRKPGGDGDATVGIGTAGLGLITITGPANAMPDMKQNAYLSLKAAFDEARALLQPVVELLAYTPEPFKLAADFTVLHGHDPQRVQTTAIAAVRDVYATPRRAFGEPVRQTDVKRLLHQVPGIDEVRMTALWVPTDHESKLEAVLGTRPAKPGTDGPIGAVGATILVLSPDADAVAIKPVKSL